MPMPLHTVMLNYAGEHCKYCDPCQSAVTLIMSSDVAMKSCIDRPTMSYIIQTKKVLWPIRSLATHSMKLSLPRAKWPGNFCSLEVSFSRVFTPRNVRTLL